MGGRGVGGSYPRVGPLPLRVSARPIRGADIGPVAGLAACSHLGEDALGMTEASLTLPIPGQEADEGGWPGSHPMGAAVALPSRRAAV